MASTKQDDGAIGLYIGFSMMLVPVAILLIKHPPHVTLPMVLWVVAQILGTAILFVYARSQYRKELDLKISIEIIAFSVILVALGEGIIGAVLASWVVLSHYKRLHAVPPSGLS